MFEQYIDAVCAKLQEIKTTQAEGIRQEVTLMASGGLRSAWDVAKAIALGADADRETLRDIAGDPSRTWYAPRTEDLLDIYDQVAGAVRCR